MFQFYPTNHSVIRAAYGYPCVPYDYVNTGGGGGVTFDSGFHPVATIEENVCRLVTKDHCARTNKGRSLRRGTSQSMTLNPFSSTAVLKDLAQTGAVSEPFNRSLNLHTALRSA